MASVLSWAELSQSWDLQTPEPDNEGNVPGPTKLKVEQHPSTAPLLAQLDHRTNTSERFPLLSLVQRSSIGASTEVCQKG